MLAQRLRRWPNIELALGQRLMFARYAQGIISSHVCLHKDCDVHVAPAVAQ